MAYAAWLIAVGVLVAYEVYAVRRRRMTLSRAVWSLAKAWPPFGAIIGFAVGFLFAHFFWPSCGPCQ